ncbi:unnamed protein product [Laminaria digitata]
MPRCEDRMRVGILTLPYATAGRSTVLRDTRSYTVVVLYTAKLTLLGPQSRFGDNVLGIRVRVSPKRECGPEGVKLIPGTRHSRCGIVVESFFELYVFPSAGGY